ncbi:hypothetical protein BASA50_011219 [Batrachochytrium salamandrivorans]|uniref:Uncharacterized protein n=1 Tax=Batrachochytrium salamandrivorans TaxID=1357716 RepID=A0ABQ8EW56_9FUNG|nr:hypothetical protein BASA62_009759 [Batrachochytrium salamandrivorans]KAH6587615.1 hypothetical protein BASA50_011219 [Batrachochytrium salamandrivorans]KAH9255881.1 hypothetical protein BASA81_006055 [Batrachochytrium salamandrivorans]KAH9274492.1 hypothetical protein BASA83_003125 [Batrachochytrium salamandrivorans]KAJ1330177.1 hypothetical protein BSLG_009601 [Batrachochytrium salamandrivorans]
MSRLPIHLLAGSEPPWTSDYWIGDHSKFEQQQADYWCLMNPEGLRKRMEKYPNFGKREEPPKIIAPFTYYYPRNVPTKTPECSDSGSALTLNGAVDNPEPEVNESQAKVQNKKTDDMPETSSDNRSIFYRTTGPIGYANASAACYEHVGATRSQTRGSSATLIPGGTSEIRDFPETEDATSKTTNGSQGVDGGSKTQWLISTVLSVASSSLHHSTSWLEYFAANSPSTEASRPETSRPETSRPETSRPEASTIPSENSDIPSNKNKEGMVSKLIRLEKMLINQLLTVSKAMESLVVAVKTEYESESDCPAKSDTNASSPVSNNGSTTKSNGNPPTSSDAKSMISILVKTNRGMDSLDFKAIDAGIIRRLERCTGLSSKKIIHHLSENATSNCCDVGPIGVPMVIFNFHVPSKLWWDWKWGWGGFAKAKIRVQVKVPRHVIMANLHRFLPPQPSYAW